MTQNKGTTMATFLTFAMLVCTIPSAHAAQ